MTQVSRDPFARTTIMRERIYGLSDPTCQFCGQTHKTPKGRPYLYRYYLDSDGGLRQKFPGLFCSIDCMRSYNG